MAIVSKTSEGSAEGLTREEWRLPLWFEILFLLLLPPLAFWLLNVSMVHQANSLDPFIYTGYINNAEDLLRRFGILYYAVRFGFILPGRFFTWMLGPEPGYLALRYVLTLVSGVPLYLFARRIFNLPLAILAYVTLIVGPWFARTLLWDHPDASGVPFLLAAMCILLLRRRPSWVRDGLAGACASMAVNSNFFTVAMLGIFGAVYVATSLLYGTNPRTLVRRAIRFAVGFLLVLTAGYCYYWWILGVPSNIFKPTLSIVQGLSQGGMKVYRTPGAAWVLRLFHVMVPVLLSVCCLLAVASRRMRFETVVCAASGTGVIAFFYVHQFLMDGDTLELYYYFSYSLPTTFLMLVSLWYALWERMAQRPGVFLAVALTGTLIPLATINVHAGWFEDGGLPRWEGLATVSIVMVALTRVPWRWRSVQVAVPMLALVSIAFSIAGGLNGFYRIARPFGAYDETERDLYRVALQFIKEVPKLSEGPGNVLFWYNNRPGNTINSVQSTYLYGYSRMSQFPPGDPGMPHIGEFQMSQLRSLDVRYLVILGELPQEVPAALQALTQAGSGYDLLSTRHLHSGSQHVYWQLVELTKRPAEK